MDHGGVLGHVEATQEGDLEHDDEGDKEGKQARPSFFLVQRRDAHGSIAACSAPQPLLSLGDGS